MYEKIFELYAACVQGKGYGASIIKNEIKQSLCFTKNIHYWLSICGNTGKYSQYFLSNLSNFEMQIFKPSNVNMQKLNNVLRDYLNVMVHFFALSNE
jgi:hypothetical protein